MTRHFRMAHPAERTPVRTPDGSPGQSKHNHPSPHSELRAAPLSEPRTEVRRPSTDDFRPIHRDLIAPLMLPWVPYNMVPMDAPQAYFLTIRTYGTWLHGDQRGSVDTAHNIFGTPLIDPDGERSAIVAHAMRFPALLFDSPMRRVVDDTLVDTCRFHNWLMIERAVRTNHVHLVVENAGVEPERMLQRLKSRATRALREQRLVPADQPVWVNGPGSRRSLWTESDVADAATYVRDYQDTPR